MHNSTSPVYKLLIIDDDYDLRDSLSDYFRNSGYETRAFDSGRYLLDYLPEHFNGVILCDFKMPGMSGLEVLEKTREMLNPPPFILMTAYGDIPVAVRAIQNGAYDFLEKPFNPSQLIEKVQQAAKMRHMQLENHHFHQDLGEVSCLDQQVLGSTPTMQQLRQQIADYALLDAPVLITGEPGAGKGRVATLLHMHGPRAQKPLVTINCDIANEQQLTGSSRDGLFLFKRAAGSTLLLDDIDTLSDSQQARLSHSLNQISVMLNGQPSWGGVDHEVRLLSTATSVKDQQTGEPILRRDLLSCLNTLAIHVPALREYSEDILPIFHAMSVRYGKKHQLPVPHLSSHDITLLSTYRWPGNVHELEHCAERFILANQHKRTDIDEILDTGLGKEKSARNLRQHVEQFEKTLLQQSLKESCGNIAKVCEHLNIPRRTLNEKLLKHGLNRLDYVC